MSGLSRRLTVIGFAPVVALLGGVSPAHANGSFQHCLNQAANHNGEPPTCTKVNGTWVASWPDSGSALGGGIPGGFIAFAVLAVFIGIGVTAVKVSTARSLAKQSGMDPSLATQMTLLSDDGLGATYLASSLRRPSTAPSGPTPAPVPVQRSVAERLAELGTLRDQGTITQAEYDERRQAIIDAV
jgi:Short C-terminal domain